MTRNHRPNLRHRRISLRRSQTEAESLLWRFLRNSHLSGAKFRRQHQIGPYIVDFYTDEHRLVLEVDGGQHFEDEAITADAKRTMFLESQGLKVVRFTNTEVLQELDAVIARIAEFVGGEG